MKLAVALQNRVLLAQQIKDLQGTISENVWSSENEEPEQPLAELISQLASLRIQLAKVILDINLSNTSCGLTALISQRDALKASVAFAQSLVTASASNQQSRYQTGNGKWKRNLSPANARETHGRLTIELIDLETQIQQLNWSVELIVS